MNLNSLTTLTKRLPGAGLLLSLLTASLLSSCNRFNADGSLGTWGFILLAIDLYVFYDIFRQSWSTGKKLLWAAIVFFFPFGGMILYFLVAGRGKA